VQKNYKKRFISQRNQGYGCWRYDTVSGMLHGITPSYLTVEYFVKVLKATSNMSTTYSTIYDPVHGIAHFYNSKQNFEEVVVFNLKDELKKGRHSYDVRSLSPKKGEISEEPEEPKSPSEMKESEESGQVSKWIPFGPFSAFLYLIPTVLLVILIALVHKKAKK
jgi:hypothetical protein